MLTFGLLTGLLASGYGVMFTVLDDFRDEYGIEAHWLGVIIGVGFFASFFAQMILAPIADRGRAQQMVVIGLLMNIVGLIGMAAGETLPVLLGARLLMGIGVGMALPAVRRIVINADPANLGRNVGLLISSDVAGFAAGPVISALLVPSFGLASPFLAIASLTAICMPVILRVHVTEASNVPENRFAFDLLRSRPILAAICLGAATYLMIGTFDSLWAIVLDDLQASDWIANVGITIFALPLIFLGSFGGRLAQRVGPFRLGPLGLAIASVYITMYGLMPSGAAMLLVGVVHSCTDGLSVASTGVAIGMVAQTDRQAGAQGMLGAAETLVGGASAVMAGALYSWGGRLLAFSTCTALMLLLVVGAYLLAGPEYRARRSAGVSFLATVKS